MRESAAAAVQRRRGGKRPALSKDMARLLRLAETRPPLPTGFPVRFPPKQGIANWSEKLDFFRNRVKLRMMAAS